MLKARISALLILLLGVGVAYFVYVSEPSFVGKVPKIIHINLPFRLGLDLSGGSELIYHADTSHVAAGDVTDAMNALQDVIERRVDEFGVTEPVVEVEKPSLSNDEQLVVDLPGVTDVSKAIALIGATPLLEFETENPNPPSPVQISSSDIQNGTISINGNSLENSQYIETKLTGQYLKNAQLEFDPNTHAPYIVLNFDAEGATLFDQLTKANIGKTIAIFLDGSPISTPTVQQEIPNGQATITGDFTPEEAKTLVGRLNSGALPIPISLISTQTIGPALGEQATQAGIHAAIIGFILVALFLLLWYRLPGLVAIVALTMYLSIVLALFKLIPVTISAAGIAGLIISIGMAVDANILIFERMKEEIFAGRTITDAMHTGFARAWPSIRDSNTSSLITAVILFWLGTSIIKGFALTFGLGVLVSMLSAITISRIFLYALGIKKTNKVSAFLFGSGFTSGKITPVNK